MPPACRRHTLMSLHTLPPVVCFQSTGRACIPHPGCELVREGPGEEEERRKDPNLLLTIRKTYI